MYKYKNYYFNVYFEEVDLYCQTIVKPALYYVYLYVWVLILLCPTSKKEVDSQIAIFSDTLINVARNETTNLFIRVFK